MPTSPANTSPPVDLSQLRDIHLPSAINEWPIAFGWWLSLALIIIVLASAIYFWRHSKAKNAVRKSALSLLDHQYTQYKANKNTQLFLQQTNKILKRYCLTAYPEAIQLSGPAWTDFLIRGSVKDGHTVFFDAELANAISQGLYQSHCQYDADALYQACGSWLKNNKGSSHD